MNRETLAGAAGAGGGGDTAFGVAVSDSLMGSVETAGGAAGAGAGGAGEPVVMLFQRCPTWVFMSVSSILTDETRNELRVALIGAESGARAIERVGRWMRT